MLGGSSWGAFRCPSADSGFMEAPPTSRSATAHRSPALDHNKKWSCHREPPPATTSGRAEPARAGRVKALPRPRSHALGRWRARLDRGGLSPVSAQAPRAQEYRADNDRPGPRRTRTRAGSHTRWDGWRAAGAGSRPRRSSTTAPTTAATSMRKMCTSGTLLVLHAGTAAQGERPDGRAKSCARRPQERGRRHRCKRADRCAHW